VTRNVCNKPKNQLVPDLKELRFLTSTKADNTSSTVIQIALYSDNEEDVLMIFLGSILFFV